VLVPTLPDVNDLIALASERSRKNPFWLATGGGKFASRNGTRIQSGILEEVASPTGRYCNYLRRIWHQHDWVFS
jgi:hypothetical protein